MNIYIHSYDNPDNNNNNNDVDDLSMTIIGMTGSLLQPGDRVIKVACGEAHSLAVTKQGYLYSWGSNVCLSLGTVITRITRITLITLMITLITFVATYITI